MTPSPLREEDTYSPLDHHPKPPRLALVPQSAPKTLLVGMHGYAQSGKDTCGRILVEEQGFERISFADPLRELSKFVDPIVFVDSYGGAYTLNEVLDDLGYEEAKKVGTTRQFLQRLGEGVRNVLGEDTWVDAAMAKVKPGGKYVFTDVRFENEAEAVRRAGGYVIEVTRPGVKPVNDHISDRRLPDHLIDLTVDNAGTVEALKVNLLSAVQYLRVTR